MINVEYLVAISVESGFCQSVKAFRSLVKSNDRIDIKATKILFEGAEFPITIHDGDIEKNKLKYFHITISTDDQDLKILDELCKEIRKILGKVCEGNRIQTLWDGIGFSLCQKAYPIIYEVENLLRKLITKFMLCNVGLSWHKESLPIEVKESIKNKSEKDSANCLYEADFIQLSNFLFKSYSTKDIKQLLSELEKKDPSDTIKKSDIDCFIPSSNWNRFFSSIVSCEKGFIEKRWKRLYELRCMVAHNKSFTFDDCEEVERISGELKPIFNEAISNLENVDISEDEKENVAESIATSRSDSYSKFLKHWGDLNDSLKKFSITDSSDMNLDSLGNLIIDTGDLYKKNIFSDSVLADIEKMGNIRNNLVHNLSIKIPDSIIDNKIRYLDYLKDSIEFTINNPKKDSDDEDG